MCSYRCIFGRACGHGQRHRFRSGYQCVYVDLRIDCALFVGDFVTELQVPLLVVLHHVAPGVLVRLVSVTRSKMQLDAPLPVAGLGFAFHACDSGRHVWRSREVLLLICACTVLRSRALRRKDLPKS